MTPQEEKGLRRLDFEIRVGISFAFAVTIVSACVMVWTARHSVPATPGVAANAAMHPILFHSAKTRHR